MMYYTISPQGTDNAGNALYLTADYSANWVLAADLVTDQSGAIDPSQLWTPIGNLSPGGGVGFMLLNSGGPNGDVVISAPSTNSAVTLVPSGRNGAAFWVLCNGQYGALQLQSNTAMNLNVLGGCPCNSPTQVAVWQWGNGASNEIWSATLYTDQ